MPAIAPGDVGMRGLQVGGETARGLRDHLDAAFDGAALQAVLREGGLVERAGECGEVVEGLGDVIEGEADAIRFRHGGVQIKRSASRSTASAT